MTEKTINGRWQCGKCIVCMLWLKFVVAFRQLLRLQGFSATNSKYFASPEAAAVDNCCSTGTRAALLRYCCDTGLPLSVGIPSLSAARVHDTNRTTRDSTTYCFGFIYVRTHLLWSRTMSRWVLLLILIVCRYSWYKPCRYSAVRKNQDKTIPGMAPVTTECMTRITKARCGID